MSGYCKGCGGQVCYCGEEPIKAEKYYERKCAFLELLILKLGTSLENDLMKWEKENPEPKE